MCLCFVEKVLEVLITRGGIREGALENLCCVWLEACVTSEPKHGVDHEGRFLGQLVSFGVNGGERFGEGCFACMYGGGAITVESLKGESACLARFPEGVAEDPATFTGEFAVLQAFEVRVRGNGKPLRSRVIR